MSFYILSPLPSTSGGLGTTTAPTAGQVPIGNADGTYTPGTPTGGTVTAVTGSGNIASSGGSTPNITFTGTLPTANGGTNLTSFTANGVVYASSSSALATGSALTFDGTNLGIGTSSPTQKLNVNGNALFEGATQGNIIIQKTGTNGVSLFSDAAGKLAFYDQSAGVTRLTLDSSGNLGLAVTPSAWGSGYTAFQLKLYGSLYDLNAGYCGQASNAYNNGTNWIYRTSNFATRYEQYVGNTNAHSWYISPSGTAGNAITFTQAMTLDASGNLGIGTTSPRTPGAGYQGITLNGSNSGYLDVNQNGTRVYTLFCLSNDVYHTNPTATGSMLFLTNNAEQMRISSNGNVGIGTTANASAILDAQSTTKGVRMPNMTTTQKNAISSPAAGLMVFDTTLAKLCVYSGSAWQTITSV